jgi:chromosome segregation ATPase
MIEDQEHNPVIQQGLPRWILPAIVILAIAAIVGVGFGWYDSGRLQDVQASVNAQLQSAQHQTAQQISAIEQKLAQEESANADFQSDLGVVTKRLRLTQSELKQARNEAALIRQESDQKLADLDSSVKDQLATKASNDDLNAVNGTVTGVKTDLAGTKNDLKMTRSELGTLIARNHEQIDFLRRMGERDYIEFTIQDRKKPQKVGNITVELRSVNTKRNQFTVALVVDDVRTERKNRSVDEPIVFYPRGSHQADELVVNSVGKNRISGYVSMPKTPATTAAASGT